MDVLTGALFSLSVGIGAIAGRVRYRKIDPVFWPFIYLLWVGFTNELISIGLMYGGYSNFVNNNIFFLLEALLICFQFYRWDILGRRKYLLLQSTFIIFWVAECILQSIYTMNSYFIIFHSFIVVLMSIHMINKIVFAENTSLLKHPVFLICMGFIVYFTYSVLVEVFWLYGLTQSKVFRLRIYEVLSYINLLVNLVYAIAILWMPMRQQYILRC